MIYPIALTYDGEALTAGVAVALGSSTLTPAVEAILS